MNPPPKKKKKKTTIKKKTTRKVKKMGEWIAVKSTNNFIVGKTIVRVEGNSCSHNYEISHEYLVSCINDERSFCASMNGEVTLSFNNLIVEDVRVFKPSPSKDPNVKPMFDILVLPPDSREAIQETLTTALNQEAHDLIFQQWGFHKTIEKGKGLIFLFWGEPGTGKTMCAQAMAEYLDRDYSLLDNSKLQSSVPGQMERNIKAAFQEAKEKKRVLILDECDSLLHTREEVGMILASEINVLLSEIERFEGVCILTTNRAVRLDPALERRLALKLEFPRPDAASREKIWRNLIPPECPLAKDVDFKILAVHDLPGGNIKNAILCAARRAVAKEKKIISLQDFEIAIARELAGAKAFQGDGSQSHLGKLIKIQETIEMTSESGDGEKKKKRGFILRREAEDA